MGTPEESRKRGSTGKREKYISWDDYFMAVAVLSAKRSECSMTQVNGACIVNLNNRIVGVGYSGMPADCVDDSLKAKKSKDADTSSPGSKFVNVCHAEMNAILNKYAADVQNCTMYVSLFPCDECAKMIIQSGIKKVVYKRKSTSTEASERMFNAAGVVFLQHTQQSKIMIYF